MLLATLITHFSGVALSNDKLYSYRIVYETPRLFLLYLYNSMSLYLPQVSYTHIIIIIKNIIFVSYTTKDRYFASYFNREVPCEHHPQGV